jgi:hypothetical protein
MLAFDPIVDKRIIPEGHWLSSGDCLSIHRDMRRRVVDSEWGPSGPEIK